VFRIIPIDLDGVISPAQRKYLETLEVTLHCNPFLVLYDSMVRLFDEELDHSTLLVRLGLSLRIRHKRISAKTAETQTVVNRQLLVPAHYSESSNSASDSSSENYTLGTYSEDSDLVEMQSAAIEDWTHNVVLVVESDHRPKYPNTRSRSHKATPQADRSSGAIHLHDEAPSSIRRRHRGWHKWRSKCTVETPRHLWSSNDWASFLDTSLLPGEPHRASVAQYDKDLCRLNRHGYQLNIAHNPVSLRIV